MGSVSLQREDPGRACGPRRACLQDRLAIFEESGLGSGVMASVSAILVR
jgi:hypothetical protein